MIASTGLLSILVIGATIVATASPVILIALWIVDARGGKLW